MTGLSGEDFNLFCCYDNNSHFFLFLRLSFLTPSSYSTPLCYPATTQPPATIQPPPTFTPTSMVAVDSWSGIEYLIFHLQRSCFKTIEDHILSPSVKLVHKCVSWLAWYEVYTEVSPVNLNRPHLSNCSPYKREERFNTFLPSDNSITSVVYNRNIFLLNVWIIWITRCYTNFKVWQNCDE